MCTVSIIQPLQRSPWIDFYRVSFRRFCLSGVMASWLWRTLDSLVVGAEYGRLPTSVKSVRCCHADTKRADPRVHMNMWSHPHRLMTPPCYLLLDTPYTNPHVLWNSNKTGGLRRREKGRRHGATTRQLGRDRPDPACQGKLLSFESRGAGGEELTAALFFFFILLLNANSPEDLSLSVIKGESERRRKVKSTTDRQRKGDRYAR